MINSRQQAYLEAMGVPVWSPRHGQQTEPKRSLPQQPDVSEVSICPGLKLGAGSGGVLLICSSDTDSASKLATDISRSMGKVPVWAWPDDKVDAINPADVVNENLFTTVAIFGDQLAGLLFGKNVPVNLHSANLVLLPAMCDLMDRAEARRELWASMCRSGMVTLK